MTEPWNIPLVFEVSLVVDADLDRIDVYCPGTGLATRKRFLRGGVSLNERLDPYALVANQWFTDHPPATVWKVGDIVPAETAVGKHWVAEPVLGRGVDHWDGLPRLIQPELVCRGPRRIMWIAP